MLLITPKIAKYDDLNSSSAKNRKIIDAILFIIIKILLFIGIFDTTKTVTINAVAIPVNSDVRLKNIFFVKNGVTITAKNIIAFGLERFKRRDSFKRFVVLCFWQLCSK